ncbi:MAG: hypothetical protein HUU25_10130, partial [Candidatus Sumerlaeia bacterium]|nr:hypothetical protein [Candidatus Sumerlaeia bacterium]
HGLAISRDGKYLHMTTGHGFPDGKYWTYVLGPDSLAGPGTLLGNLPGSIDAALWLIAALTMTVGNVLALLQTSVKRLLAYSSIAQAGYVLMGLAVMRETPLGMQGALIYLLAYLFMNLGAFAVVIAVSNALGSDEMDEFGGLAKRSPGAAAALTVFLLSLTGIPPMAGFVGKFVLFAAVIEAQFYALALIAAVNSVVAAFYYFRIVRAMYLEPAGSAEPVPGAPALRLAVALTLAGTLAVGLWPAPFLSWATAMPMMGL